MDLGALTEINADVWLPFREAYRAGDHAGFLVFHHPDLVRVEVSTGWLGTLDDYAARVGRQFAHGAERGDRFDIDFRFEHRIATPDLAFEQGVYRVTITPTDGVALVVHGRFRCLVRRTAAGWRLAVDQDDDEGGTVDADAFDAARALDDLDAFAAAAP